MPDLIWDIESRSAAKLKTCGAWRYAADPTTEVLCLGYAIGDAAPKIWTPGQPIPGEFIEAARDPQWRVVAHNAMFEYAIASRILRPKYNWPEIPLARYQCTLALALARALPGELNGACEALGLPGKDAAGHRLMMEMAQPRKRRKGEDPNQLYWIDSPEKRERLQQYCARDVEIERGLFRRLPPLPVGEEEMWRLDQLVNERGFFTDVALAKAARVIAEKEKKAINTETEDLTAGTVITINQRDKILAYVRKHGHVLEKLGKRNVAAVLAHGNPGEQVRRLLELRRDGARASTQKFDQLLASVDTDHRLRGTLKFHGAATGRWSGRGYQPQNLFKTKRENIDAAIEAILSGDLERVRALGAPLTVAAEISRSVICAAPGRRLIGGDFSSVESRVLAWLANETWKLDNYREYDRTGDPRLEPYCVGASMVLKRPVTPDDETGRELGKVFDLSFGFGGGLGAWRRFDNSNTYTDAEVEKFKQDWRQAHRATVRFWHDLERAAHRAVATKLPVSLGNTLRFEMDGGTLLLTLPSGRSLAYPEAKLGPGKFDFTRELRFRDNARGSWVEKGAWYGTITENVVQAVSRDLLAAAMLRLEAGGYSVVLHVHDEIVCEVPEGFGGEKEFLRIMLDLPEWAEGLPLAAKTWSGKRYAKSGGKKPKPAKPTEPVEPVIEPAELAEPDEATIAIEPLDEEVGGVVPLAALIGKPLIDGKICCPFHADDVPSLHVYSDHYHCFGCGASGDAVDWLMQADAMSRQQAKELIANWDGPTEAPRRDEDDAAILARALRIWEAARPIKGTPAESYLARRRIDVAALPGDALRFHARCPFGPAQLPCLIALFRDVATDALAGIHRIALPAAPWAPGTTVERRMLGRWPLSRAIKLWPAGGTLVVGEGIETALAAATRIPYRGEPLRPAWALVSAGAIGRLGVIPGVERLIILIDHDLNGTGQEQAARCADRWSRAGRSVVKLLPQRRGADFNDLVLAKEAS
jgi:DNA polymerase